jgi:gas vesicle protein
MESTINETMNTVKNALDAAREGSEQAMDAAKHGTQRAVATTRSTFFDAVHAVTGAVAILRKLDGDDALGWVGLARRRSPFAAIAAFGAGMMVGTGVGLMLAPSSGAQLRAQLLRRFSGLTDEAKATAEHAATNVREAAEKTGDAVKQAEHKLVDKVAAGGDAVKRATDEMKATIAMKTPGNGTHQHHS